MSQPSGKYEILRVSKDEGAIIYGSGAHFYATGATGVGGVHRSAATSNNWNNVRFLHVASKVDNLPTSLVPASQEFVASTGTILGGSTPIGDIRGEGTGFIGVGDNTTLIQKNTVYSGALYAIYEGAGATRLTGKIGIGTTSADIATSGYYEGTFKTKDIHEFETVFLANTGDLTKFTTGSGVYRNETFLSTRQIVNREGKVLRSASELAADPFISGQRISILNRDGSVAFSNYKDNYLSTLFSFSRSDNEDVFSIHERNFGVRTEVVDQGGAVHTTDFFAFANSLSLEAIVTQASGVSRRDESTGNISINTGSITNASDREEAIKGFSNQIVNNSGVTGFISFDFFFDQSASFTNYDTISVYVSNTGTGFNLSRSNFLGDYELTQTQGHRLELFPNDFGGFQEGNLDLNQDLFFKFKTRSNVAAGNEVFSIGPYRLDAAPQGKEVFLGNAGEQSLFGDLALRDSGISGTGQAIVELNQKPNGAGGGVGTISIYDDTGDSSIKFSSDTGVDSFVSGNIGIGTTVVPTDTTFSVVGIGSTKPSFMVRAGIGTTAGFVGIGTTNPKFNLDASDIPKANIAAARSKINSTGSAIMGGADHQISGDFNMIAGGVFNNISGNDFSFIGGGSGIDITGSIFSTSIGGFNNDIFLGSGHFIGGGHNNMITGVDDVSVIVGGKENKIFGGNKNFIGAGATNVITGDSNDGIIIGGTDNKIIDSDASTIGGGILNTIDRSSVAFCVGGTNTINFSSTYSAILGGITNEVSGSNSVILGGQENTVTGNFNLAAGHRVKIGIGASASDGPPLYGRIDGATVLADGQDRDHISSGSHTATFDFASGVYVPSTGYFNGLHVSGVPVLTGSSAEADTLQTVTTRGNTTSTSILSTGPHISGVTGLYSDKVGIGTTSPTQLLDVARDTDVSAVIGHAHIGNIGSAGNAGFAHIDMAASDDFALLQTAAGKTTLNSEAGQGLNFNVGNVRAGGFAGSSDFFVDTDTLYVDASESKVGIGTDSPSSPLVVINDSTDDGITLKDDGFGLVTIIGSDGSHNARTRFYNGAHALVAEINANAGSPTYFNAGNVGIGTSSPDGILNTSGGHVLLQGLNKGYIRAREKRASTSDYDGVSSSILTLANYFGQNEYGQFVDNVGDFVIQKSGLATHLLKFSTTDMTVSGYGIKFAKNQTVTSLAVDLRNENGDEVGFYSPATNVIGFVTDRTERMRIDSAGNVGIGAASPSAIGSKTTLDIDGSNGAGIRLGDDGNDAVIKHDATTGFVIETVGTVPLSLGTEETTVLTISDDQKVGIGTASPEDALTIAGTSADFSIRKANGDLAARIVQFDAGGAQLRLYDSNSNEQTRLAGDGSNSFITGNVGIGITNPNKPLQVVGGISGEDLVLDAGNSSDMAIQFAGSSNGIYCDPVTQMRFAVDSDSSAMVLSSNNIQFGAGGTSKLSWLTNYYLEFNGGGTKARLNAVGLGIGTTDPTERLDVRGNAFISGDVSGTGDGGRITLNGTGYLLSGEAGTEADTLQTVTDRGSTTTTSVTIGDDLAVDTDTLFVDASTDRVGINTNSLTTYDFEVQSAGSSSNLGIIGGSSSSLVLNNTDTSIVAMASSQVFLRATGGFFFQSGVTTRAALTKEGDFGIGTASPSQTLHVKGIGMIEDTSSTAYGTLQFGTDTSRYIRGNSAELQVGSTIQQLHFQNTSAVGQIASSAGNGTDAIQILARTVHTSANILEVVNGNGAAPIFTVDYTGNTEMIGDLSIKEPNPTLNLQDTSDDDDHQINFKDNGGSNVAQITTAGDDLNLVTVSSRDINLKPGGLGNAFTVVSNGDVVVNTDTFFIDASNDNVGIGTASPQDVYDLNIYSAGTSSDSRGASIGLSTLNNNTTGSVLRLTEANYIGGYLQYDCLNNKLNIGVHSDNDTDIANDNIAITVDRDTAKVGIGTDTPLANLHVKSNNAGSFTYDTTADELIVESNADGGITIATAAANTSKIIFASPNDADGAAITYNQVAKLMNVGPTTADGELALLSANGVETMRLDENNHVGIGTASPSRNVSIFQSDSSLAYLQFANSTTTASSSNGLEIGINGDEEAVFFNRENTDMIFRTNNTDRLRILAGGNVGIGTASPLATLDVRGDISGSGSFLGTGVGNRITNNHVPYLLSGDVAVEADTLATVTARGNSTSTSILSTGPHISGVTGLYSGKVSIGTSSPSGKLEINTSLSSSATLDMFQSVVTSYPSNTNLKGAYIELNDDSNAGGCNVFGIDVHVSHKQNHASNRIYGVHSVLDNTTAANNQYAGYFEAPTAKGYLGDHGDSAVVLINAKRSDGGAVGDILRVEDSDVEKFTIVDGGDVLISGNVGIGTTNPSSALEVRGGNIDIGTNDLIGATNCKIEMDAADGFTLTNPNNAHGIDIVADDLTFFGGGIGNRKITTNAGDLSIDPVADLLLNENGGNVGIGTASPSNALDVIGHFSATSKSFLIDHPIKENKKLQYGSLEGPENGVYVRGTSNSAKIELPDYWSELVHEDSITVSLTALGKKQNLFVKSKSPEFIIVGGVDGSYDYVVYGERKDIDKLEVEPLKV